MGAPKRMPKRAAIAAESGRAIQNERVKCTTVASPWVTFCTRSSQAKGAQKLLQAGVSCQEERMPYV